jgi:glycosyltransferase involved in cell wall biosynthesis
MSLSIVIVAKNEAHIIGQCLQAALQVSNDVIVYTNNSTDNTEQIAKNLGAKVIQGAWLGYGATKNQANNLAKYNWILSLDADEVMDDALIKSIKSLTLNDNYTYNVKRYMMWQNKLLRFGQSIESKPRLFNKQIISWNNSAVHEALIIPASNKTIVLNGKLLHFSYKNWQHAIQVQQKYAALASAKIKPNKFLAIIKATASFINTYIIQLGMLDGKAGWQFARLKAYYKYIKYAGV